MQFDLPIVELAPAGPPPTDEPPGFDVAWAAILRTSREVEVTPELVPTLAPKGFVADDVTYRGLDERPVRGRLVRPANAVVGLPTIVELRAADGQLDTDVTRFARGGFAHLVTELDRPDEADDPLNRDVFSDALRAVHAVRSVPGIDPSRTAMLGAGRCAAAVVAVAGVLHDTACVVVEAGTVGPHRDALVAAARRATTPLLVGPGGEAAFEEVFAAWGASSGEALGAMTPHGEPIQAVERVRDPEATGRGTAGRTARQLEWVLAHTHQAEYFVPRVLG